MHRPGSLKECEFFKAGPHLVYKGSGVGWDGGGGRVSGTE